MFQSWAFAVASPVIFASNHTSPPVLKKYLLWLASLNVTVNVCVTVPFHSLVLLLVIAGSTVDCVPSTKF